MSRLPRVRVASLLSVLATVLASVAVALGAATAAHAAGPRPIKVAHVHGPNGVTYTVRIWAEENSIACAGHATGEVATYLATHRCTGLRRLVATTVVDGRAVGFQESYVGFGGSSAAQVYRRAGAFAVLLRRAGTGDFRSMLAEGDRLPHGPAAEPAAEVQTVVGQDNSVAEFRAFFLHAPTAAPAKALRTMSTSLFLQF